MFEHRFHLINILLISLFHLSNRQGCNFRQTLHRNATKHRDTKKLQKMVRNLCPYIKAMGNLEKSLTLYPTHSVVHERTLHKQQSDLKQTWRDGPYTQLHQMKAESPSPKTYQSN